MKDKTVFITGGTSGIGLETVRMCTEKGARAVAYSVTDPEDKKLFDNENTLFIRGDITKPNVLSDAFKETIKTFSSLDILINNASIAERKPFIQTTPDEWRRTININIEGTLNTTKQFLDAIATLPKTPRMIINIASGAGLYGIPEMSIYSLTKAALINFSQSLHQELAEKNIDVIAITPGSVDTSMFHNVFPGKTPHHTPQEVADVVIKTIRGDVKPDDHMVVDGFHHER